VGSLVYTAVLLSPLHLTQVNGRVNVFCMPVRLASGALYYGGFLSRCFDCNLHVTQELKIVDTLVVVTRFKVHKVKR